LRYFGHDRVSLLDGGITQWIKEGHPLQQEVPEVPRGLFTPHPHPEWVVDKETVTRLVQDPTALVLDSRAPERYRGEVEPIDPRAGHIPGAKSAPLAGNLIAPDDLRFRKPEELRARFETFGPNPSGKIVAYCGSGINACHNILALELAGYENALLYEGSWSDWCGDPNKPAAVGPNP
jgi:thiosulfate/3-mercaptopyruvate sulfurtransferase